MNGGYMRNPIGAPRAATRSGSLRPAEKLRAAHEKPTANTELARLLEHPAIWRGRSAARREALPTGFGAFDECLPGRGWPRTGLVEILVSRFGIGELYLLLPALAALTSRPASRWCMWVTPPLDPFPPALEAHGIALDRLLVVRAPEAMWAFEQSLRSGACDAVLAWSGGSVSSRRSAKSGDSEIRELRRLQLAAERGRTLGVLFRPRRAAQESSPAVLRVVLEPSPKGVSVTLLKSRGGARGSIELALHATGS